MPNFEKGGGMGLLKQFFNQTRKPEGALGKIMVGGMNSGHAKMSDWGFAHLPEISVEKAVDLGCGGGRSVSVLLDRYPKAQVTGIDYSDLSVQKSTEFNKDAIAAGRCTIKRGDVSALDLAPASFDLATAFETVYFWPGLAKCFGQVANILKPGGLFMVCNESDGMDASSQRFEAMIDGMRLYTAEDIETALGEAGFSGIVSEHHPSKPWIVVLARKS